MGYEGLLVLIVLIFIAIGWYSDRGEPRIDPRTKEMMKTAHFYKPPAKALATVLLPHALMIGLAMAVAYVLGGVL